MEDAKYDIIIFIGTNRKKIKPQKKIIIQYIKYTQKIRFLVYSINLLVAL